MHTLFILLCLAIAGMDLFSVPESEDNVSKSLWIINALILMYIAFKTMAPAFLT